MLFLGPVPEPEDVFSAVSAQCRRGWVVSYLQLQESRQEQWSFGMSHPWNWAGAGEQGWVCSWGDGRGSWRVCGPVRGPYQGTWSALAAPFTTPPPPTSPSFRSLLGSLPAASSMAQTLAFRVPAAAGSASFLSFPTSGPPDPQGGRHCCFTCSLSPFIWQYPGPQAPHDPNQYCP